MEQLQKQWGHPKKEYFNFDFIGKYRRHSTNETFHQLSFQTLTDIDFYDLFSFIDRTTSRVGQQVLFDKLNRPTNQINSLQIQKWDFILKPTQPYDSKCKCSYIG